MNLPAELAVQQTRARTQNNTRLSPPINTDNFSTPTTTTTGASKPAKGHHTTATTKWMAAITWWAMAFSLVVVVVNGQVLSFPRLFHQQPQATASRSHHHSSGNFYHQRQQRQTSSVANNNNNNNSSSTTTASGWHFPRLSQEQAADVILTGVQVIGKIAQAETSLNFCRTPDGQDGECSDIRKCLWLMLDRSRLRQSVCLRNLIIPAVCCPSGGHQQLANSSLTSTSNELTANGNQQQPLLKAKAPRKRKPLDHHQLRPLNMQSNTTNSQIVSGPPSGPASLIIRNPTTSSTTTTTTTTTTRAPDTASSTGGSGQATVAVPTLKNTNTSLEQAASQLLPSNVTIYPWTNSSGTCGEGSRLRTGRIVGGSDSKLGQWPWMSAIYLSKNHGNEFWCGGALINSRYILTAAHCLSDQRGNKYLTEHITVKLGGVDLVKHQNPNPNRPQQQQQQDLLTSASGGNNPLYSDEGSILDSNNHNELSITQILSKALLGSAAKAIFQSAAGGSSRSLQATDKADMFNVGQSAGKHYFNEYKASSVKQHPKFQRHGFYNDIGLIELAQEVQFDDHIQPVCLPGHLDQQRDFTGYMATVLGWGTLSYGGSSSKSLQQVTMPIWTNKDCDDRYLQPIGKTFLCAGFLQGGKDACQGDSGGPLMISDATGRWTLHGIVSFGKTCAQAGYPGVYTKVTEYLDWIKENIQ